MKDRSDSLQDSAGLLLSKPPASALWSFSFNLPTDSNVRLDTTGFSRVEFQFQPTNRLERSTGYHRLQPGGVSISTYQQTRTFDRMTPASTGWSFNFNLLLAFLKFCRYHRLQPGGVSISTYQQTRTFDWIPPASAGWSFNFNLPQTRTFDWIPPASAGWSFNFNLPTDSNVR